MQVMGRHISYTLSCAFANDAPVFDCGTAIEVFKRAGCTGKGKRQLQFIERAGDLMVVRLGWMMYAVDVEQVRQLTIDFMRQNMSEEVQTLLDGEV